MSFLAFLFFFIPFVIILVFVVKATITKKRIVNAFRRCNTITYGKKGGGKGVLFQEVIHQRRAPYAGNVDYGGKFTRVWPSEISVAPNTYQDFIEDKVKVIPKKFPEDLDFYIDDGGIVLPSQYDSQLHKTFPSLPIFYALSRHLNNGNVHINTQNLGRVWKALREQADYYVRCRRTIKLPFFLLVSVVEYDKYESAEKNLLEFREGLFNKFQSAEAKQYEATNGFIREGWVIVPKRHIKYDTRAYHEIIYGEKAPTSLPKNKRRRGRGSKPSGSEVCAAHAPRADDHKPDPETQKTEMS